jgi:hypothetical protein
VTALAIVVVALAWCGISRGEEGEARLVIESPVHDFGDVNQGVFVRHVFPFRNAGGGDVRIGSVRAPCGCTAAVTSGAIAVSLDTGRFQGQKTKTVFVSTSDETHPVWDLTLTGYVTPKVAADPPVIYLGRIRPGAGATGEVHVLSTSGGSIEVADAAVENPLLDVSVEQLSDGDKAARRVLVRVPPGMPSGRFNDRLRITITSPEPLKLDVPIFGNVEGDLLVEPHQVMFGSRVGGPKSTRELRVHNSGLEPISISEVRVPDFPLDYSVSAIHVGYEYRVVLRLIHPTAGFKQHGDLHIYTTHPEEPELIVPLYAMMQRRGHARP